MHTLKCAGFTEGKFIQKYGKIEIDDNCFIGANCIILPNVYLGKNCIVGAGSVVTKSFPENSVIAGVPARKIKSTKEYALKVLSEQPTGWNMEKFTNDFRNYLEEVLIPPNKRIK